MRLHSALWRAGGAGIVIAGCSVLAAGQVGALARAGGSTARPAGKATTIVIGSIENETGTPGQTGIDTTAIDILNAWAKWTNANGGIAGHPVKFIGLNDDSDPAQSQTDLDTLVDNDKVAAIVGQDAVATLSTWQNFIDANKVPVVGGEAYDVQWFTDGLFYPTSTTVESNIYGQVYAAKQAGKTKYASLVCTEEPSCESDVPLIAADAKQAGVDLVYNEQASNVATDYTAQCLAMQAAGATAINTAVNNLVLYRDCALQHYHPLIITTNYEDTVAEQKANPHILAGLVGPSPAFPPFQSFPATASYFAALKKYAPQYAPGGSKYENVSLLPATQAWVAAEAFAKAVELANVPADKTVTRADVMKGLSMFHNQTLGGMSPLLTFGGGKKAVPNPQVKCFYLYKTSNNNVGFQTVPANSLKTFCQP